MVSSTKHFQTSFHCKGECCSLGKHGKVRLTRLAAGDAMGEKLPMIVIGKFAKPHVSVVSEAYPVVTVHKNSWMDGSSFADWVKEVNRKYASWDRKIALIINSYPPPPLLPPPPHPKFDGLKALELIFLPPNLLSKTQPAYGSRQY